MKLLPSQKDILFDLIVQVGLSPSQFEFGEIASKKSSGKKATKLKFVNSEYYFLFETGIKSTKSHLAVFCPGETAHTVSEYPGSWDLQLNYVRQWLRNLVKEINSPNKWDRLKKEIEGIKIKFDNDEDKFSVHEYEDLQKRVLALKQGLTTIGLLDGQVNIINEKLDHLTELAKEMNKFDWKSLFIGTIISIVIQLGVTQNNARLLWDLIKQVFNNYLLP